MTSRRVLALQENRRVVDSVRIERRIEIYKIDRLVLDIPPQDIQTIAVSCEYSWVK